MQAAFKKAVERFGDRARVGRGSPVGNWSHGHVCYVGWTEHGEWRWIGWGKTWDEAFASVRKVKLHVRDKLVVHDA